MSFTGMDWYLPGILGWRSGGGFWDDAAYLLRNM